MLKVEQELTELIARMHGIPVEDVTEDFIEEQQEMLWDRPDHSFVGGGLDLEYPNRTQLQERQVRVDAFLAQFIPTKV